MSECQHSTQSRNSNWDVTGGPVVLDGSLAIITCDPSRAAPPPARRRFAVHGLNLRRHMAWHDDPLPAQGRRGRGRRRRSGDDGPDRSSSRMRGRCAASAAASVIAGFAGATADAIALFERLEAKLEQHSGQLTRACVELAKDWRTDRYLRRLEAMMAVADKTVSLILSGTGDVLEPEDGIIGIGSGGGYALAAARALIDQRRTRRRDDRPARDGDRRRHLRLHQRQGHHRKASTLIADDLLQPARDRLRARPLHRRPERRQARRRHRAAQPLAPPADCPPSCARRCCPRTS